MLPKRRFWKMEQKMKSRFSIYLSMVRSPNRVLTPFKSASKIWISSFVNPSKILFSPNEEFARPNQHFRAPDFIFCSPFQNLRLGGLLLFLSKMFMPHSTRRESVSFCSPLHNPAWVSHRRLDGDSLATHWRVGVVTRKRRSLPFCICRLDTQT